jgi:hypothetical protein
MRASEFRAAIANDGLPAPHARFGIYRRNVNAALVDTSSARHTSIDLVSQFRRLAAARIVNGIGLRGYHASHA